MTSTTTSPLSERGLVALLFAVQVVNVLDFVMVMPLGPDFAEALGIAESNLGYLGGSYTAAAAVTGLVGATFLDRFDRRQVLLGAMLGLSIATALGGLATGFPTLLGARILAGVFGGPATSIGVAIIADVVPAARRGKAIGALAAAFSVVSVLGLPFSLWLAGHSGWQAPFFVVALFGIVISLVVYARMPPLTSHLKLETTSAQADVGSLLRPEMLVSYAMASAGFLGAFLLIPNLSAFVQHNLGLPRAELGLLYLVGGLASFGAMRLAGSTVDRLGSTPVATFGTVAFTLSIAAGFVVEPALIGPLGIFVGFMVANAFRMVAINTLVSRIPGPTERARFMSAQSAVQHLASAAGAMLSAQMLTTGEGGALVGVPSVGVLALVASVPVPLLLWIIERRVRGRERVTPSFAG